MTDLKADIEAAKLAAIGDRNEGTDRLEPLVRSQGSPHRPELTDLAIALAQAASCSGDSSLN